MSNLITRKDKPGITSTPIFTETKSDIAGISSNIVIEMIAIILKYSKLKEADEIELFLNNLYKKTFVD